MPKKHDCARCKGEPAKLLTRAAGQLIWLCEACDSEWWKRRDQVVFTAFDAYITGKLT